MTDKKPQKSTSRKPCPGCGGSGQIAFFRGVSRFVMDWDDCPDCLGTGYVETAAAPADTADSANTPTKPNHSQ